MPEPVAANRAAIDENFARSIGPDYWEKRRGVFDFVQGPASPFQDARLTQYVGAEAVTFKGPAVKVEVADPSSKVLGTLQSKAMTASRSRPAIVARTHGKGRVVYLAAGFDASYYLYSYPYQRLILSEAIRWAASAPPDVEVRAPLCVQATVMRQTQHGERLVVHLFNDVNTTAFHAKPDEDVPLREEVLPIHDITLTFAPGLKIRRFHVEPDGQILEPKTDAEGRANVVVPRLDVHAMVVAEVGEGKGVGETKGK